MCTQMNTDSLGSNLIKKRKTVFLVLIVVVSFIVDFKAHLKTTFLAFENLIFFSIFNLSHFRHFASLVELFYSIFVFVSFTIKHRPTTTDTGISSSRNPKR